MRRMGMLLLCLLCAVGCAACSAAPTVSDPVSDASSAPADDSGHPQSFALPYSREDTLNPYTTGAEANLQLASLLYDSLTVIDDTFTPQRSLAGSVEFTDACHVRVTLRKGARFSDGSAVTPGDVAASYRQAKAGANYRYLLTNVTAADPDPKAGAVVFTLASADPNAAACLSFPVSKDGTQTAAAGQAPLGGGIYCLQTDSDVTLTLNPYTAENPHYRTVLLRHLPNSDTMYYGLTSGSITYYYNDLSSGDIPRVSGSSAAVNMNDLLYLGVNANRADTAKAAVRRAISLLIERKTLAAAAYSGWALPATMPFHPAWSAVSKAAGVSGARELTEAIGLLEQEGYGTATGQKPLTLELICSSAGAAHAAAAECVRSHLESAGIRITVTPLPFAEYKKRVAAGKFDLYLGEIRLSANMSLDPMLGGGSARYGIRNDSSAVAAYRQYRGGEMTVEGFIDVFSQELPYIPLCWRCGFAGYDRRLNGVTPHGYNPYFGIENWY